jgi:hypothetical protein
MAEMTIPEQLRVLQKRLPEPVQQAVDALQRQYEQIINNPNLQQATQQVQQWQNQFQALVNQIPAPLRETLQTSMPGVREMTQALRAKQVWDALPDWGKEMLISAAPGGDALSLIRQGLNAATNQPVDKLDVTLSTYGLASDLGWLDGIVPDPADAVNFGIAFIKGAVLKMDGPAREAMLKVMDTATRSAESLAKFAKTVGELTKRQEILLKHPNVLPKLLEAGPDVARRLAEQSDSALARALSNPVELQQAIARAKFADKFIGQPVPAKGTTARAEFDKYYTVDVNNVIRRKDVDEGFTKLQVDQHGNIKEATGNVTDRLSNPSKMRANYGPVPQGHQIHHLIPDAKVRDHELAQLARQKPGCHAGKCQIFQRW